MENKQPDSTQAELELTVIRKIMEDSRRAVYNSSMQGVFWSTLISITLFLNFFLFLAEDLYKLTGILWLVSMILGSIVSIWIGRKEKREIRVKTFAGKILATLGISVGGANIIFSFASVIAGAYNPLYIVPIDSIVMGMAFFVISVIQQIRSLEIIAYLWWAGAVFFFVFPGINCLLFLAVMLLVSVWVPKFREKRAESSSTG